MVLVFILSFMHSLLHEYIVAHNSFGNTFPYLRVQRNNEIFSYEYTFGIWGKMGEYRVTSV